MRYARQIAQSISGLPPLQAERRLRNRMTPQTEEALDAVLETGEGLEDLRSRLGEYDQMLLDQLMTSPTARPRKTT